MSKVKAKNMTKRDAIPVLEKVLNRGDFGKRKTRALEIAIQELRTRTASYVPRPRAVNE